MSSSGIRLDILMVMITAKTDEIDPITVNIADNTEMSIFAPSKAISNA